jgi:hypothetical protein
MLRPGTHRWRGKNQRSSQSAQSSTGPSFPHWTLLLDGSAQSTPLPKPTLLRGSALSQACVLTPVGEGHDPDSAFRKDRRGNYARTTMR